MLREVLHGRNKLASVDGCGFEFCRFPVGAKDQLNPDSNHPRVVRPLPGFKFAVKDNETALHSSHPTKGGAASNASVKDNPPPLAQTDRLCSFAVGICFKMFGLYRSMIQYLIGPTGSVKVFFPSERCPFQGLPKTEEIARISGGISSVFAWGVVGWTPSTGRNCPAFSFIASGAFEARKWYGFWGRLRRMRSKRRETCGAIARAGEPHAIRWGFPWFQMGGVLKRSGLVRDQLGHDFGVCFQNPIQKTHGGGCPVSTGFEFFQCSKRDAGRP